MKDMICGSGNINGRKLGFIEFCAEFGVTDVNVIVSIYQKKKFFTKSRIWFTPTEKINQEMKMLSTVNRQTPSATNATQFILYGPHFSVHARHSETRFVPSVLNLSGEI
jgi:hypothetical protein